jgi:hypothetical protein
MTEGKGHVFGIVMKLSLLFTFGYDTSRYSLCVFCAQMIFATSKQQIELIGYINIF